MYKKKIIIGISGGVDSTACCILLSKKYDVTAVFMQNWEKQKNEVCNAKENINIAKNICDKLKIKFKVVNFSLNYYKNVFLKTINEYKQNKTPNPDVLCNKKIKFNSFIKYASFLNIKCVATGHYSKLCKINNNFILKISTDKKKDQTYFLCLLKKTQLKKSLFPLGNYFKKDVRLLLKKTKCQNYKKKDSTGICFIENKNFNNFLQNYIQISKGTIYDTYGNIVGTHKGTSFYTIGQRKGIITFKNKKKQIYVIKKILKNNKIIITEKDNVILLCNNVTTLEKINYNPNLLLKINTIFSAKVRHQQNIQQTLITHRNKKKYTLFFLKKQKAITQGQITSVYFNNFCVSGGNIINTFL